MAITLEVTTKDLSGRTGTKDNPFVSGGILFEADVQSEHAVKLEWTHRWTVGGVPSQVPPPVEEWYGRDGLARTPKFHPNKKTTLSMVRITCTATAGDETETAILDRWVMAAGDEPVPTWNIQCDDGRHSVNKEELDWLKDNNHLSEGAVYYWLFDGTRDELDELLETMPGNEPEPTGHPIVCSDGTIYATTYELTWLLNHGKVGNAGGKTYFNGEAAQLAAIIKVIPPKPEPDPPPDDEEPEEPMEYRYFLPLRTVDTVDTGVFLSTAQRAEVKIKLFKQRNPSADEGELQGVKMLTLGAYNAVTEMVKGNWHTEADVAVVSSKVPIVCCAVWVTKDETVQYTGFPGLEG